MGNIFTKYMKEKDPSTDHAVLSASGSERWLGCPGSVALSEGIPAQDSPASIRGTKTHTLLQFILENSAWEMLLRSKAGQEFKDYLGFDAKMLSNAMFAIRWIWTEMARMDIAYGKRPQIFTEVKVELKGVGFGTSDVILYHPFGLLHVIDYKNGTKTVDPEGNTQGLYYAHAAADRFNWEFNEVWITIVQPNATHARGQIRTWKTNETTLDRAGVRLRKGALATKAADAPLVKNDGWCWFCPARPKCPLHQDGRLNKTRERFGLENYG